MIHFSDQELETIRDLFSNSSIRLGELLCSEEVKLEYDILLKVDTELQRRENEEHYDTGSM